MYIDEQSLIKPHEYLAYSLRIPGCAKMGLTHHVKSAILDAYEPENRIIKSVDASFERTMNLCGFSEK
ncbi:hypothetical protein KFU94_70620 [Chloroflexi bacterium TSY]|nr:hypothetical protein [Chloroflexi bacterium TSY]